MTQTKKCSKSDHVSIVLVEAGTMVYLGKIKDGVRLCQCGHYWVKKERVKK